MVALTASLAGRGTMAWTRREGMRPSAVSTNFATTAAYCLTALGGAGTRSLSQTTLLTCYECTAMHMLQVTTAHSTLPYVDLTVAMVIAANKPASAGVTLLCVLYATRGLSDV